MRQAEDDVPEAGGSTSPRQTVGQVAALAAIPFNLTLALSVISPLLPTIRHDLGITATVGALLYTTPLICFAALAPFAPRVARRLGAERVIAVGLVVQTGSMLLRSGPGTFSLFFGTLLLGVAGAAGNVLVPGIIKRRFGRRAGPIMGLYSTASVLGSMVGAAASVPLMHATGRGWRFTLALWTLPAAVTLLVWLRHVDGVDVRATVEAPAPPWIRRLYRDHVAWEVTLYYGMQNLVYTGAVAWLPTIFVAHGISQSRAGLLLAIVNLTGMATTLTVPLLAARRPSQTRLAVATAALLTTGIAGLLVAPVAGAVVWMVAFGLGQGAAFSLALSLILLRSVDADHATELSGMTLTLGYLFGGLGPVCLGAVHDLAGGWSWSLRVLLLLLLPLLLSAVGASRDRQILASRG